MTFLDFDAAKWTVLVEAGTLFAGIAGVLYAVRQYKDANATRKEDLRWRQAERADAMLDQILGNPKVVNAFHLLDWDGGKRFLYVNGDLTGTITANWEEQNTDLGNLSASLREMFVRESFDALYEAFERLEHAIRIGVVDFTDIAQPFRFYVDKIGQRKDAFEVFEANQSYKMARYFIARYATLPALS